MVGTRADKPDLGISVGGFGEWDSLIRFRVMSESRSQFAGTLLLILTVAADHCRGVEFSAPPLAYPLHDDGVTWIDQTAADGRSHVIAAYISPGGPGDKAGISCRRRTGCDRCRHVKKALDVPQALWQIPLFRTNEVHAAAPRHRISKRPHFHPGGSP